jgi:hypothetical protein
MAVILTTAVEHGCWARPPVDQAKGSLVGVFLGLLLFFAQDCRKRESYVVQQRFVRVHRPTEPERSNADEAMAS